MGVAVSLLEAGISKKLVHWLSNSTLNYVSSSSNSFPEISNILTSNYYQIICTVKDPLSVYLFEKVKFCIDIVCICPILPLGAPPSKAVDNGGVVTSWTSLVIQILWYYECKLNSLIKNSSPKIKEACWEFSFNF